MTTTYNFPTLINGSSKSINLIYNLLTPDGMLAITAYQCNVNNYLLTGSSIEEKVKETQFNDFFEKIENFLYKKKDLQNIKHQKETNGMYKASTRCY